MPGKPDNIRIGPGHLYAAPLATAEPVSCSAALPSAAWVPLGYTEQGTTIVFDRNWENIDVAEELEPVDTVQNRASAMIRAQLAEATRRNLLIALSGNPAATNDAATVDAPIPGAETGFMLVWDKLLVPDATNVRWLFRRVKSRGSIEVQLRKSPNKALIPVEFQALVPSAGRSWRCFPNSSGHVF